MRGPGSRWLWLAAAMTVIAFAAMAAYAAYAGTGAGSIVSQLLVSGVFAATGLAAWVRRPQNRLGPLMVAFAWTFMAIVLTKPVVPLLVPLGLVAFIVSGAVLAYIVLAYPSGELRTTTNRALVAFTAVGIGAPRLVRLLATEQMPPGSGVPNPWYLLQD